MNTKADICILVHYDITTAGRVLKEATSLASNGWSVVVVCLSLSGPILPKVERRKEFTVLRVSPTFLRRAMPGTMGKLLRLMIALPTIARCLRRIKARVYNPHDFIGLLITALSGIWHSPIVYDSHELFFDRFPEDVNYPLKHIILRLRPLEKILARRAVAVITVSELVAERLAKTLNIPVPILVRNAVDLRTLNSPVPIQRQNGQRIVAHSGSLTAARHLPELVSALTYLPEDVTLALIGDGFLRHDLVSRAAALGVSDRLLTIFPVTPRNIPTTLAQADVATVLIASSRMSYHLSLPNKIFDAIAAGVPVVASPIPEVANLIREYEFGVLCDPSDPRSIASAILDVLKQENWERYRANALKVRDILNWESEEPKLVKVFEGILSQTDN